MKRVLYIGINTYGSTSAMRANKMKEILNGWEMDIIDTDIPYNTGNHILKSLAFRYKIGPLIKRINNYILAHLRKEHYDLIWVDKAIFITPKTTKMLRERANVLVHYTPDPAFTYHQSKIFYESMPLYDFMITTKTYEVADYIRIMNDKEKVLYVTQGFDKKVHRPLTPMVEKRGVAFIGRHEIERETPILILIKAGIDVYLAGGKWRNFAIKHNCPNLHYLGDNLNGDDYVKALSSCLFALGAVSKWIPEKHTTRTFEIPACKTALLTERNEEIEEFYTDSEVIYYKDTEDILSKVQYYLSHKSELYELIENGYSRVQSGGFDFESIMKSLLKKVLNLSDDLS